MGTIQAIGMKDNRQSVQLKILGTKEQDEFKLVNSIHSLRIMEKV
jgi:hypothetical protein